MVCRQVERGSLADVRRSKLARRETQRARESKGLCGRFSARPVSEYQPIRCSMSGLLFCLVAKYARASTCRQEGLELAEIGEGRLSFSLP
jgi:hypothetical protein